MSELKRSSTPSWQWKLDQWWAIIWKQCKIVRKLLSLSIGSHTRTCHWYHFHWFTLVTSWLPVLQRVTYKLGTIVYKCVHQSALEYLQESCMPVTNSSSRRHLCSAACGDLQVLATRTVTYGPHSFAACAKLWNSLPTTLWHSTLTWHSFVAG